MNAKQPLIDNIKPLINKITNHNISFSHNDYSLLHRVYWTVVVILTAKVSPNSPGSSNVHLLHKMKCGSRE